MPITHNQLPDSIPEECLNPANQSLIAFKEAANVHDLEWPDSESFEQHVLIFFACCLFGARFCVRYPKVLLGQQARMSLDESLNLSNYKQRVATVFAESEDEFRLMSGLRVLRQQEMIRIAWRDLLGFADTTETLRNLSELAEAYIDLTFDHCCTELKDRFGVPRNSAGDRQQLVVLGMGKLGGMELNYSSDIDLILAYPESGETDGRKVLDNTDFYRRVTQKFVRLLNESTADGFVFRVDLRLRPFGSSGPIAMTFDAMEAYYQTQGREWERYAMIKARVVSGEEKSGKQLFDFLRPFVFRRYLDYSAFESLRDMKAKISLQVQRKGMHNNVKLGAGGIREIEFIGQAFQLVRGGKETELQQRSIVTILGLLTEMQYLDSSEVDSLLQAYDFLRRTENRLQMVQDQQTHVLPDSTEEQKRLAYSMGFENWQSFAGELQTHRNNVEAVFEAIFKLEEDDSKEQTSFDQLALLWSGDLTDEEALEELTEVGYSDAGSLYEQITQLGQGGFYSRLTNIARDRLDRIIPNMLRSAAGTSDPDETARRLMVLMRNIAGRSVYVQVLLERPQSMDLLVRLFAESKWLAEFVSAHPMVIDEILDHRILQNVPDEAAFNHEMKTILARVRDETLDVQMDAIRQFRQANVMRVAAADLENLMPIKEVSNRLTTIAEVVLQATCDLVWDGLVKRHGSPRCTIDGVTECPGFAIVGYGKLGGLELGYGSDLDIVFLHGSSGEKQMTDGDKVIDNSVFFARMAQKTISFLNTMTSAGTLYEIDTRLRPNGQSGMLVSSLQAFESYQLDEAWTWEHQSLVRARFVAGDERIRGVFDTIRRKVLGIHRDREKLRTDVVEMRERMRRELSKSKANEFDLKQDSGGIVDIEFMVQYSVLAHAHAVPDLMDWTDNVRILETLSSTGFLNAQLSDRVTEIYFSYREYTHKRALQGDISPVMLDADIEKCREDINQVWQQLMVESV